MPKESVAVAGATRLNLIGSKQRLRSCQHDIILVSYTKVHNFGPTFEMVESQPS
jgi:hypothetical protein